MNGTPDIPTLTRKLEAIHLMHIRLNCLCRNLLWEERLIKKCFITGPKSIRRILIQRKLYHYHQIDILDEKCAVTGKGVF